MAEYEADLIQFDAPPRFRNIKLPAFWSDKPASWFALAESCFRTHGITGEQAKFDQLVGALSKESLFGFWTSSKSRFSSLPTHSSRRGCSRLTSSLTTRRLTSCSRWGT